MTPGHAAEQLAKVMGIVSHRGPLTIEAHDASERAKQRRETTAVTSSNGKCSRGVFVEEDRLFLPCDAVSRRRTHRARPAARRHARERRRIWRSQQVRQTLEESRTAAAATESNQQVCRELSDKWSDLSSDVAAAVKLQRQWRHWVYDSEATAVHEGPADRELRTTSHSTASLETTPLDRVQEAPGMGVFEPGGDDGKSTVGESGPKSDVGKIEPGQNHTKWNECQSELGPDGAAIIRLQRLWRRWISDSEATAGLRRAHQGVVDSAPTQEVHEGQAGDEVHTSSPRVASPENTPLSNRVRGAPGTSVFAPGAGHRRSIVGLSEPKSD
eukprot:5543014-Prymnesium_polylepis.1